MALSDDYWFPWYPLKMKADTMHLSALQDGIYRRLIDHYMETQEALPNNNDALARIAGVPVDMFVDNSVDILKLFRKRKDGRLYLKRCEEILRDQKKRSKIYRKNGKKGGKARAEKAKEKQKDKEKLKAIAKQLPSNCSSQSKHRTGQDRTVQDNGTESLSPLKSNKDSKIKVQGPESFSIERELRGDELDKIRNLARGWDVYWLCREFDKRVRSGRFERPKKPYFAFMGWVKNFTKGKKPA